MRRLIYLLLFGLLLFGAVAFAQIPPGSQTADEATARAAWLKVDAFEPEALRAFLSEFPESGYVKDAKALLVMHQRIADYRSRKAKPQFIISTKQLGARWTDSKAASERDIVGFAFVKTDFEPGVGLAGTLPLFKGTGTVRYTSSGPALPTRDGSILAIKTYGMNTKEATATMGEGEGLFGGFHFVTPDTKGAWPDLEGTLFFAVLDGVGLVHIYGEGKVISPGGKETVLREPVRRPN